MQIKIFLLFFTIVLNILPVYSQNWENIKSNSSYVYGLGKGSTVAEADSEALRDLMSKISLHTSGSINQNEFWFSNDGKSGTTSEFSIVFNTYSQATLNNTEKIILKNEPNAEVGRWIKRSDIEKIFESRKFKILDYVASAEKAESKGKIDIALKDYYWALELLKSLQDPTEVSYSTADGDNVLLQSWIPQQMNEILKNIKVSIVKREGDEVNLLFTYKKKPVNSIDYSYFDGRDWSNLYSAKDGIGVMELAPGNQSSTYSIRIEYEYRGESHVDREVESVIKVVPGTPMRNAYLSIKSKVENLQNSLNKVSTESFSTISKKDLRKPVELNPSSEYKEIIDKIIYSITSKKYANVESFFTPYGWDIYQRLIKYGNAKLVGQPDLKFYRANDNISVRGLQLSFNFKNGIRKSFVEDIVFYFNDENKIDNISFGLGKTTEDDILGKGVWSEDIRFAIINFLENYQTAYALKRLDYIASIFDDDAIIITGSVAKAPARNINGDIKGLSFTNNIIKYNRHTKDSYLKQLKRSFESKDFINIRFADNEIRKLGKGGEWYAIQISQEYYSSNYGDKGYLFLMIDMNDPQHPIIKIRTWQPEKDPEFGIYGPGDFN